MDTLDVRPQSQASTARLSRKSGEEEYIKSESPLVDSEMTNENAVIECDSFNSPKAQSVNSLTVENEPNELETQNENGLNDKEESRHEEYHSMSRLSKKSISPSGVASLSRQESRTSNSIQNNETIITPEVDLPVSAIPIDREDSPEKQSDPKSPSEEIETKGQKSPLTVELPQEEKDEKTTTPETETGNSRSGYNIQPSPTPVAESGNSRPQSHDQHSPTPFAESGNSRPASDVQHSPTPVAESGNSRPQSEIHHTPTPIPPPTSSPRIQSPQNGDSRHSNIENPIEALNISPQENQPEFVNDDHDTVNENDINYQENKSPSPNGKNDSAISSSSSVSSEPQREDQPIEDRQETPIIEAA